jgi:FlaG/FlaF family flagellin (archaellin)
MVAITVAIAAVVYIYVQGLIPSMSANNAIPQFQLFKSGDTLIVQQCTGTIAWSSINITGTATKPTGTMTPGQSITGCSGHVTIVYDSQLVGTYDF